MIFVSVSGSQRNQRECDKRRQRETERWKEGERKETENWNSCICDVLLGKSDFCFNQNEGGTLFCVLPLSDCLF